MTPVGTYREEKKRWMPAVNIIIGVVIGIIVSVVLVYPTMKGNTLGNNSSDITEAKEMLSVSTDFYAGEGEKDTAGQSGCVTERNRRWRNQEERGSGKTQQSCNGCKILSGW